MGFLFVSCLHCREKGKVQLTPKTTRNRWKGGNVCPPRCSVSWESPRVSSHYHSLDHVPPWAGSQLRFSHSEGWALRAVPEFLPPEPWGRAMSPVLLSTVCPTVLQVFPSSDMSCSPTPAFVLNCLNWFLLLVSKAPKLSITITQKSFVFL